MANGHLRHVIPGAVLSAISAIMLLFGGLFAMIYTLSCNYSYYGYGYSSCSSYIGPMGPISTGLIVTGIIMLIIGLSLIFKGISVYRSAPSSYKKIMPSQSVIYSPSSVQSYAPVSAPAPLTMQAHVVFLDPAVTKISETSEKKYCPSCGAALPEGSQAHFCPTCGGAL